VPGVGILGRRVAEADEGPQRLFLAARGFLALALAFLLARLADELRLARGGTTVHTVASASVRIVAWGI
jgi:hypothetical protein